MWNGKNKGKRVVVMAQGTTRRGSARMIAAKGRAWHFRRLCIFSYRHIMPVMVAAVAAGSNTMQVSCGF